MSAAILPTTPSATTSTPPPIGAAPRPIKWTCDDLYKMENLPSVQNQKIMLIDGEILVTPPPSVLASVSQQLAENCLRALFPSNGY